MLDNYTFGEVERISPEAPVPVVLVQSERVKLGGAANVADNLVGLKNKTTLCGAIGTDQHADLLTQILAAKNIENACLRIESYPTIFKIESSRKDSKLSASTMKNPFQVPLSSIPTLKIHLPNRMI